MAMSTRFPSLPFLKLMLWRIKIFWVLASILCPPSIVNQIEDDGEPLLSSRRIRFEDTALSLAT